MENTNDQSRSRELIHKSLEGFATKLKHSKTSRKGEIVFHLSGETTGQYNLSCGTGQITAQDAGIMGDPAATGNTAPLIEVSGDAGVIRDILDGKKDPIKQFLVGGLRIRGDLRHFSDLAVEMNLIKQPL